MAQHKLEGCPAKVQLLHYWETLQKYFINSHIKNCASQSIYRHTKHGGCSHCLIYKIVDRLWTKNAEQIYEQVNKLIIVQLTDFIAIHPRPKLLPTKWDVKELPDSEANLAPWERALNTYIVDVDSALLDKKAWKTVYRATTFNSLENSSHFVGKRIRFGMWLSTNKAVETALEFGTKTLFMLKVPKGCYNGTSMKELAMLNEQDDDEVLIPPYSVFLINSIHYDVAVAPT